MEDRKFECWVGVPGTEGRFAVSNLGRFRTMAKKERHNRRTLVVFVNEPKPLVCDYKTGLLGWWVYYDGAKHFFARDELMTLFPECCRSPDTSLDESARAKREETYMSPEALRERTLAHRKGIGE